QSDFASKDDKVFLDTKISSELKLEGDFRVLIRILMDIRKEKGLKIGEKVKFQIEDTAQNKEILRMFGEELKNRVDALEISLGSDNSIC
nr:hypothetical protein [Patescibacteria group bacterium]